MKELRAMKSIFNKPFPANVFLQETLLLLAFACPAQDLSQIGKTDPMQISGYAGTEFYGRFGRTAGLAYPSNSLIWNIGLNTSLYGWNLPFSVTYSDARLRWQQPFNHFSLQPSWKWIHLYLGDASMNFSPYSLNGHQFSGAGAELEPPGGNWKFSLMSGRLQKAISPDTAAGINGLRQRYGYGFMGEFASGKISLGTGIFYASDVRNNREVRSDSLTPPPSENLVVHLRAMASIQEKVQAGFEYACSFFTPDTRMDESDYRGIFLVPHRQGSGHYNATRINVRYSSSFGVLGFTAERVDPGYTSLGTWNIPNDFASYSVSHAGDALQKKISWALSSGWQHDNLKNLKKNTSWRLVHTLNLSYQVTQALFLQATWSNFTRYVYLRTAEEQLGMQNPWQDADTLRHRQVTESGSLHCSWQKEGKTNLRHQISFDLCRNTSRENTTGNTMNRGIFITASGSYTFTTSNNGLNSSISFQYSKSTAGEFSSAFLGPAIAMRKLLAEKKLPVFITVSYNKTWQGTMNGNLFCIRTGVSYNHKMHSTGINAGMITRKMRNSGSSKKEVTLICTYRCTLDGKKNRLR